VQVSTDGGSTWHEATLDPPIGEHAWRGWSFTWSATTGEHELWCRARVGEGGQPDTAEWNVGGYANNAVQRVAVDVVDVSQGGVTSR
jgi:hypothetical protein